MLVMFIFVLYHITIKRCYITLH